MSKAATKAELQKRIEQLKQDNAWKDIVLNATGEMITVYSADLRILWANQTSANSAKTTVEKMLGKICYKVWYNNDSPCSHCPILKVLKSGKHLDGEYPGSDGIIWWIHATPVLDDSGNVTSVIEISRDYTQQIRYRDEIKRNEGLLNSIFQAAPLGIGLLTAEGHIGLVNEEMQIMTGFTEEELTGRLLEDLFEDKGDYTRFIEHSLSDILKYGTSYNETVWKNKNGSSIELMLSTAPVDPVHPGGDKVFSALDISLRKERERALFEREELYRVLFENNNAVKLILDAEDLEGKIVDANPAACEYYGYSRYEFRNMRISDINILPAKEVKNKIKLTIQDKERRFQFKHQLASGEIRDVESFASVLEVQGKRRIFTNVYDITDLKRAEEEAEKLQEQLFQAQKMESIGRLAGGIAHDFNNILTSISGYTELLQAKLPPSMTEERDFLNIIFRSSERAADLTSQLLGFARKGKYNPVVININKVIRQTLQVIEKMFKKNINIHIRLSDTVEPVDADEFQLEQVLSNLLINAKDAMSEGGELYIETSNAYLNAGDISHYQDIMPGRYVKISITDTGCGISKETQKSIFEPFFTTKPDGQATGLGLATVYGIVKNHHGHITVYSEVDKGSTFNVFLPVAESEENRPYVQPTFKPQKGTGTILLIDDEETVRSLAKNMLGLLGYSVILAENGKEAIKIFKKESETIDLVLLDMIMPEMAGKETYTELVKINPSVQVILISGFTQDGNATEVLDAGAQSFLQKPFKIQELSQAIDEALNRPE